jgi:hypothetical protein
MLGVKAHRLLSSLFRLAVFDSALGLAGLPGPPELAQLPGRRDAWDLGTLESLGSGIPQNVISPKVTIPTGKLNNRCLTFGIWKSLGLGISTNVVGPAAPPAEPNTTNWTVDQIKSPSIF